MLVELTIVNRIQVMDVETRIGIFPFESFWEKFSPSAVAHENCSQVVAENLINHVVLIDFWCREIRPHVDESWEGSRRHSLQSLQSGCRWVGEKLEKPRVVWLLLHQLVDDGKFILIWQRTREILVINSEVIL